MELARSIYCNPVCRLILADPTALSMVGYWHHTVVRLSVCPSVCNAVVVAKGHILQQVSEQVNRKCLLETRFSNFQPIYTDLPPQTPHLLIEP